MICTCRVWEVRKTVNFKKKLKCKRLIHTRQYFAGFIIQSINFNLVKLKIVFRLQFQDIDLRPQQTSNKLANRSLKKFQLMGDLLKHFPFVIESNFLCLTTIFLSITDFSFLVGYIRNNKTRNQRPLVTSLSLK